MNHSKAHVPIRCDGVLLFSLFSLSVCLPARSRAWRPNLRERGSREGTADARGSPVTLQSEARVCFVLRAPLRIVPAYLPSA